jgi:hypothetical protein
MLISDYQKALLSDVLRLIHLVLKSDYQKALPRKVLCPIGRGGLLDG